MTVNRLERGSDLNTPGGREQLQETLDLMASKLQAMRDELTKVREQDKIVAPVPIEAYPVVSPPITAGSDVDVGAIIPFAYDATGVLPPGYLFCDGSAVSRSSYSALFSAIGIAWGAGDGVSTFNLPNLARRALVGKGGSSTSTLGNTVGSTGGAETHALTTAELATHSHTNSGHSHDLSNHTHTGPSHTHTTPDHNHGINTYPVGGGATVGIARGASGGAVNVDTTHLGGAGNTGSSGTGNTGTPSTNSTSSNAITIDNTGSGTAHNNMQPSAVVDFLIRVVGTPGDTQQQVPVQWGPVPASWNLDFRRYFPFASVSNVIAVPATGEVPEPFARVSSSAGVTSGTGTLTLTGVVRVPYNFRNFKTRGIRIRTKVGMTGCGGGTSVTVQLKVSNPLTTSGYLGAVYSRTISVSAGNIADAAYVDAKLTKEDLGPDWKPGYMLRFELSFTLPRTYTTAVFDVGALRIDW